MGNEHNRTIYQLVDQLLAAAGYQPESSARHHLGNLDFHVGDAEIARLRAKLAERDAELQRLRLMQDEIRKEALAMLPGYVPAPETSVLWLLKVIGTDMASLRTRADACDQRLSEPRTDAEWKAADRRKRINDLAARYAGEIAAGMIFAGASAKWGRVVEGARALAAAVVEAEE